MSYYILENDETKGPYTLGQLRSLWNSGAITKETLHSQEGYSEWLPLSSIIDEIELPATPPRMHHAPPRQFYEHPSPPKKQGVGLLRGCLVVLIAIIILGVVMSTLMDTPTTSSSTSSSTEENTRTMSVRLYWGLDSMRIENTGSPDLSGKTITVYINGMPPFAYKVDWPAPALGETVTIPLNKFVKKGSRFNPTSQAVTEAWVGGAGYGYKAYGKR